MKVFPLPGLLALLTLATLCLGQSEAPPAAVSHDVDAPVTAVTVYRGRASVTRSGTVQLVPGLHELRILHLPETIQPETLQARVSGTARVLEVQFDQIAQANVTTPETESLDRRIVQLKEEIGVIDRQRELILVQEQFLAQVGVRAANDATDEGGTGGLDLDAVRAQLEFITTERTKLIDQRAGLDPRRRTLELELIAAQQRRQSIAGRSQQMRMALVAVVAADAGECTVELTYLVANATWLPSYNVRAAADGSVVDIEYDALLNQRTGEDWTGVDLTLSTAQPMVAANPPTIDPWFVDVRRPQTPSRGRRAPAAGAVEMEAPALDVASALGQSVMGYADDAEVAGQGPSVTYLLPRPVTVQTNIQKQQRTRIATIQSGGDFIHVAIPLLTNAVYIRGTLTNHSAYQLLPGPVSLFVGQDYVGPTRLEAVPPVGEFEMFFGIDPSVTATRTLIEKKTTKTGLLGGGLKTSYDYRIEIENGAGKGLMLELWDRYPVSRSDQITIELADLSRVLATDPEYVEEQKPLGLLKWRLGVPVDARGATAFAITYGVRINRAKNVNMTGLPE